MVLLNVAGLAATAPPLGTLLLYAFLLGDTAALYSLSKAPSGSVPGGPTTFDQLRIKAEIVRAVRSETSAFASNTAAVKEKIIAAVKSELADFNVKPSDTNRLTGFTNAWTTGLQKGRSLTDAIKILRKDPGVVLLDDMSGEPFLLHFIKAVIEAVKTKQLDLTLGERVWDTVSRQSTERVKERNTERSDMQKNALAEANKRREQYPGAKAAAADAAAAAAKAAAADAAAAVRSTAAAAEADAAARSRKTLTTPTGSTISARAAQLAPNNGVRMVANPLARRGGASKSQVTEFLRLALEKDQPPGAVEDAFGLVATVDPADKLLGKRLMPVFDEFLLFRGKAEDTGLKNTKYSETQLGSALNMFDQLLPDYFDAINPAFKDIVNDPSIASIPNADMRMSPKLGLTPTREARFLWGQALMKVLKQREGDAAAKAEEAASSADKAAAQAAFVKAADAEVKLESPLTSAVPGAKSTLDNVKAGEIKRLQEELKNAKDGLLNFQRAVDDATARIDTIEGTKGMKLPSQDELEAARAELARLKAERGAKNRPSVKKRISDTEEQIRKLEASAAASQTELEVMLADANRAKNIRTDDLEAVKKKIADLTKSLTAMGAPLTDATVPSPPPPILPPPRPEAIASLAQRNAAIAAGWKTDKDDANDEYWYHDDVPGSQWDVPSAEDIKKSTAATAAKADKAEAEVEADAATISHLEAELAEAKAAADAAIAANAGREKETAAEAEVRNAAAAEAEALGRAAAAARNEEAQRLAREKEAAVKRADAADAAAAAARVNGEKAAAAQAAQAAVAAARAAADLAAQKAAAAAAAAQAANLRQQLEDARGAQADAAAGNAAAAQAAQAALAAAAAEIARLKSEADAAKTAAAQAAAAAEAAKSKAAEAPSPNADADPDEAAAAMARLRIADPSAPPSAASSAPATPGAAEIKAEVDSHPEWKKWKPTMSLTETERLAKDEGNTRARYALYKYDKKKYPNYLIEAVPYPPAWIERLNAQKAIPGDHYREEADLIRAKRLLAAMPEEDKTFTPTNKWSGGGRRRKHMTPKKRKARKSTFRRHRKH